MRRETRQSSMLPIGVITLLLIGVFAYYQLGTPVPELDDRLCPKDTGPRGATILLLDTSDPLTPKHRAELERLSRQIASEQAGPMGIEPHELLAVYQLTEDPSMPRQLIEVCRPRTSPQERTWRDDIRQGRRFSERDWKNFEEALANVFPEDEDEVSLTSPLLETISVLAARHVPGKRGDRRFKVHLVVFSDLLQHSPRLSHYGAYPDAGEMRERVPDLFTDLEDVRVSLFRLERPNAKWQTKRHYFWWTELIREQGGQIEWQDSI